MINKRLAAERGLSPETVAWIECLHRVREVFLEELAISGIKEFRARQLNDLLDRLEGDLQKLWGFPQDSRFIKYWYRPGCLCPKMDNEDNYPSGYYVVSEDCPLHGGMS